MNIDMAGLMSIVLSAGLVLLMGPILIPKLHQLKFGQSVRGCGPESHQIKSGTPTMGGIMIILAITITTLLLAPHTPRLLLALFVMLGHFVIGFIDDYIKVVKKRNLGLRAWQKLLGQLIMASIVTYINANVLFEPTCLWLPLYNDFVELGPVYYILGFFVLVGTSNAVNLTDGLDGLAAGTMAVAALAYAFIASYCLQAELSVFALSMAGACIGFLYFNHYPARIFMGDTGSLALGGALAAMAMLTGTEFILVILGGVFVMEALSVIIQVISFKTTGKRVFLMSPLHHHFELKGWKETQVVYMFWTLGVLFSCMAIKLLYMMPIK